MVFPQYGTMSRRYSYAPGYRRRLTPVALRASNNLSTRRMYINNKTKPSVSARGITPRQQIRSLVNNVRKLVPEIKFFDVSLDATNISLTVPVVTNLIQPDQGTDIDDRVGDTIRVKSITINGIFVPETAVTAGDMLNTSGVRWAVVVDTQQAGYTSPAASDVFEQVAAPWDLLLNRNTLSRFKILHLSRYISNTEIRSPGSSGNPISSQGYIVEFNWIGDLEVRLSAAAGNSIQKNGIYFMVFSSLSAGAASTDFDGTSRIGYTDS